MSDTGRVDADLYAILNVAVGAPENVIRAAANALAREWHPDRNLGSESTQRMQEINLASSILLDAEKRAQYDDYRRTLGVRSPPASAVDAPFHFPSEMASLFLLRGGSLRDPENYVDIDVYVSRQKVEYLGPLLTQLDVSIKASRSVILIAPDVDDEVVATFRINNYRGVLRCATLVAPGYGRHKAGLVEDTIAITAAVEGEAESDYVVPDRFVQPVGQPLLVGHAERATLTTSGVNIFRGAGRNDLVRHHMDALISVKSAGDDGADSLSTDPAGMADRIERLARYLGVQV